jgi:hypothetical protein
MKKIILSIACSFAFLVSTTQVSLAQTAATDTSSAAAKSKQITTLLTSKLNLSTTQASSVSGLVTTYADKFSTSNKNVSSSTGMKATVEKEAQSKLGTDFSNELPKLLDAAQKTKYSGVKDQVNTLFKQIK